MNEKLTLSVFTVDKVFDPVECDSVRLSIADSVDGSFSGSYGIKKGHAPTVFTLKEGEIIASENGKELLRLKSSAGFASVKYDVVSVTVEKAE